jgi:two-component system OmpR family response regulator
LGDLLASDTAVGAELDPYAGGTPIALVRGMPLLPSIAETAPAPASVATARAPQRRVLVVDDDARARAALALLLSEEGYDATMAADGEEASGMLISWHPDLVVTDLNMPRLDGCGLLQRVRQQLPGTPVLVMSARSSADPSRLEGLGAAGFVAKPVQLDELLARIHDLIGD